MKRKALLIGNSNGLQGVKLDINSFINFLRQDVGGHWYDSEITIKMDPTKADLLSTISQMRRERNDFSFAVFSGHGAYQKGTVMEINNRGETINEDDLKFISSRQISIFDCCRNVIPTSNFDSLVLKSERIINLWAEKIRAKYDARIMQAIEQQVSLYACSVGESALDTENGGLYINNLLKASKSIQSDYKLVGNAHEEAAFATKIEASRKEKHQQNPTATLPKCMSFQQLIISINH